MDYVTVDEIMGQMDGFALERSGTLGFGDEKILWTHRPVWVKFNGHYDDSHKIGEYSGDPDFAIVLKDSSGVHMIYGPTICIHNHGSLWEVHGAEPNKTRTETDYRVGERWFDPYVQILCWEMSKTLLLNRVIA